MDDYGSRMNDTAKKDVRRPNRVPSVFFRIVSSQFYKLKIWVYENA